MVKTTSTKDKKAPKRNEQWRASGADSFDRQIVCLCSGLCVEHNHCVQHITPPNTAMCDKADEILSKIQNVPQVMSFFSSMCIMKVGKDFWRILYGQISQNIYFYILV